MKKIHCRLIVHSNDRHLQHLYTGFLLIAKFGLIEIIQKVSKQSLIDNSKLPHLRDALIAHLDVVLDGTIRLHYDTHDSFEIDEDSLSQCDYYFKRSFSKDYVSKINNGSAKILPLGLYYPVVAATFDIHAIKRSLLLGRGIGRFEGFKTQSILSRSFFVPNIRNAWSVPDYDLEPKILFMVRAWNPFSRPDQSIDKIQERESINEMRANCIKLLRREFGNRFYGGFIHTDFAKRRYPEHLMPDKANSIKRNYFNLLRKYSICIATSGLHGSIGAKFAEYIAFSKAIISEKQNYEVPGDFSKGRNYLEFESPEECVSEAVKLFSNKQLKDQLMENNQIYYHRYLRPDSQVLRTITLALSGKRSTSVKK